MEPGWPILAWLGAMLAAAWFWHDSLGARERANLAAEEACRGTGARLLDGTVAFSALRPVRVDAVGLQGVCLPSRLVQGVSLGPGPRSADPYASRHDGS